MHPWNQPDGEPDQTVSFLQSVLIVTLNRTCKAFTLAGTADINTVAYCEGVCLYDIAYVQGCTVCQTKFLQRLLAATSAFAK